MLRASLATVILLVLCLFAVFYSSVPPAMAEPSLQNQVIDADLQVINIGGKYPYGARICGSGEIRTWGTNLPSGLQMGRYYHVHNLYLLPGPVPGSTAVGGVDVIPGGCSNCSISSWYEISGCPSANPPPAAPPQVIFSVDQSTITRGQCVNIRWDVDNVRAVYFNGHGVTGHEGRQDCPSSTTTYTLRVVTGSGDIIRTATVNVSIPQAVLNFQVDRTTILRGDCTTLFWNAEYVQALYLNGSQVGSQGNKQVCPSSTTTYNMQVAADSGNFNRSVTVNVIQRTPTPIPPTATPPPPPSPTNVPPTATAWVPTLTPTQPAQALVPPASTQVAAVVPTTAPAQPVVSSQRSNTPPPFGSQPQTAFEVFTTAIEKTTKDPEILKVAKAIGSIHEGVDQIVAAQEVEKAQKEYDQAQDAQRRNEARREYEKAAIKEAIAPLPFADFVIGVFGLDSAVDAYERAQKWGFAPPVE